MKFVVALLMIVAASAYAESTCDIRLGLTVGVPVVEFVSGTDVHSKIPVKEMTSASLQEEMLNLQDMGDCSETIIKKRCVLKYEKVKNANQLTLIRGNDRWLSWKLSHKKDAQEFTKRLQKAGYCL
jgi:hypothetical protein